MSEVKLCKDCRYSRMIGTQNEMFAYYCTKLARKDPVLGINTIDEFTCMSMREEGECGRGGLYWEQKL